MRTIKLSLCFLLFLLMGSTQSFGQQYGIKGTVQDSTGSPMISASVVLLNAADSTLASFAIANPQGNFEIEKNKKGDYVLQIIYLGYKQYYQDITLDSEKDLGVLILTPAINKTDEVVIKADRNPMSLNKDTIVYNADAFQTQPNEMVEDLLKKLPGIEVEDDGSIKAQGEDVEQVLVDGEKFFGDDPTIATRNLPAKAVDKVEVFDKKSDQAEFTGIDDGEREKTINLELKEDAKKGYFGQISAGYGTDNRYEGRASVNRFSKGLQISVIGNLNNINQQGFSVDEYMNFMGGIGGFMGGGNSFRFGGNGISFNSGLSDGFVDTKSGGLNLNYKFGPKIKLSSSYFYNGIENVIERISTRENFLESGSYFENSDGTQASDNLNHNINAELEIEIDSTQDLKIRGNFRINDASLVSNNLSTTENDEKVLENQSIQDYISNGRNDRISGNLTYRKKFGNKGKSILTLNGNLNSTDDSSDGDLAYENSFFTDPNMPFVEEIVQNQLQTNEQTDYSIRTTFTQTLSKDLFLDINYRRQNYSTELIKDVFDLVDNQELFNTDLSDHFTRDYEFDRIGTSLTFNKEKYSLTAEVALQNSRLYGDIISDNTIIDKKYTHILPRLNYRYEFGRSKNISFRYNTSIREPSLTQLQPFPDNSDPLNIYQGNPDLRPEYRHNFRINLFNYDQFTFRSFFAFINMTYTKNAIVNQKSVDEFFVQTTTPVNVSNAFSASGNFNYGSPLKLLKTRINLSTRVGYNRNILFLNSRENISNRYNTSVEFRIENRKKDKVDINVGTRIGYNITTYSEATNNNQDYINQKYFGDFTYNIGERTSLSTSMDYDIYSAQAFGEADKVPIWKASFSYYVLKNKKLEFKAAAFDILNQNLGINRTSNLNFLEYETISSLGRHFMFSLTYALSGLSGDTSGFRGGIRMMRGG